MPSRNPDRNLALPGDSEDILLAEKTRTLYRNSGLAAAVNVSIAVILYFSLHLNRSDWLWLILSVSAARCGLFVWDKWQVQNEQKLILKYRIALAVIALQGAAWGLSSLILYSSFSDAERFYMVAVLVGITGGSVLTLSPAFAAFFVFVAPAICPLLVVLIFEETDVFRHVGVMGLIYVAAIIAVSRRINFSAIEQIVTRKKLEEMNRELKIYQDELEEIVSVRTRNLQLSEERYRDSFEKAVVGMAVLGLDGSFLRTNPAFQDMLGYSSEELAKKNLFSVTAPEDRNRLKEQLQTALDDNSADLILEEHLRKKSGETAEVIASFRIINGTDEQPRHFIGQILDVTERRRVEREQRAYREKQRQSQKMESIGTLAGGIAHDFNNILAAIIGYAELTKRKLADRPKEKGFQEEILKAGKRGKQLVQQILVFSRKSEEKREKIRIAPVVEEALSLIRQTIPTTTPIDISLNPQTGTIEGDPLQIHQIVINLCTNAYHAVRDVGGKIEVRLEPVQIEPALSSEAPDLPAGAYAQLTITDTGSGIPAEVKPRIFEPFFTTKKQGEGTGMGLAIVYGIVQNHGGFIEVTSEAEIDTSFRVLLPLLPEEVDQVVDNQAELPGGSERLLFVDDEAMLAELAQMSLETLGYQVTATTSAAKILDLFRRDPAGYDLIITDQAMPEMPGIQLAKALMAIRADIPVILCTGFSESVNADQAKALGIKAFALKPIEQAVMARTIREVLDAQANQSS